MCFSPYFMNSSTAAELSARLSLKSKPSHLTVKEEVLKAYGQVGNRLLETYITDDVIAKTYSKISLFVKLSTLFSLELANDLWLRRLDLPMFIAIISSVRFPSVHYCSSSGHQAQNASILE